MQLPNRNYRRLLWLSCRGAVFSLIRSRAWSLPGSGYPVRSLRETPRLSRVYPAGLSSLGCPSGGGRRHPRAIASIGDLANPRKRSIINCEPSAQTSPHSTQTKDCWLHHRVFSLNQRHDDKRRSAFAKFGKLHKPDDCVQLKRRLTHSIIEKHCASLAWNPNNRSRRSVRCE